MGPSHQAPMHAPPPERPFSQEVGRDPGQLRIAFTDKSPYGEAIDPEIAAAVREVASLLARLGHHVEERAPTLAADPAVVMTTIVGGNTALNGADDEQRFGRAMTDNDLEILTLACAHNARTTSARPIMSQPNLRHSTFRAGFATFFETLRRLPLVRRCARRRCVSARSTRCRKICRISAPILRRYMPGTSMFNMSGQPAMSVPLAWNKAGLPLGMMFAASFGDEATLFRLAGQLEQERPWKDRLPPVCAYRCIDQPFAAFRVMSSTETRHLLRISLFRRSTGW